MASLTRETVIIFAKQPQLGQVKTRLARSIGLVQARRLYCHLLDNSIARLGRRQPWRLTLAVTPDGARWRRWPQALPWLNQGQGDLGQRMERALRAQARPRALIVGSDVPGLSAAAVRQALELLRRHDFVFGPSADGGYWAIGWHRRAAWPQGALRTVRWSSPHALADSVRSLGPGRQTAYARPLDDLDDLDALLRLHNRLRARTGATGSTSIPASEAEHRFDN